MKGLGVDALQWRAEPTQKDRPALYQAIVTLDHHSRRNHAQYFRLIEKLAEDAGAGESWHHLDVFPLRETSQKSLIPFLRVPKTPEEKDALSRAGPGSWLHTAYGIRHGTPLSSEMFDATLALVKALAPKVIVVLSSHASRMLEHRLALALQPNGHRHEFDGLPGVPFLLGSQLSGGTTSAHGRRRLLADLRDVLRGGEGLDGGEEARSAVAARAEAGDRQA